MDYRCCCSSDRMADYLVESTAKDQLSARYESDYYNQKYHDYYRSASISTLGVLSLSVAIGFVFVVYTLKTSNPHAKEYLIGWIIAAIVVVIAWLII